MIDIWWYFIIVILPPFSNTWSNENSRIVNTKKTANCHVFLVPNGWENGWTMMTWCCYLFGAPWIPSRLTPVMLAYIPAPWILWPWWWVISVNLLRKNGDKCRTNGDESENHWGWAKGHTMNNTGWWFQPTYPSEKWWSDRQLGWFFHSQYDGKVIKFHGSMIIKLYPMEYPIKNTMEYPIYYGKS